MKRTATKRRTNTAMVFNPARGLTLGGRKSVRKSVTPRANPVKKTVVRANPFKRQRRRNNPASVTGLVVTAVMAGVAVSLFDVVTSRVMPAQSSLVRAGVKLGGAWLFQSSLGSKLPVLGKYKNDIALVLAVAGVVDLMKLYVLPVVNQFAGNLLPSAPAPVLVAAGDETTAGLWDTSYQTSGWGM